MKVFPANVSSLPREEEDAALSEASFVPLVQSCAFSASFLSKKRRHTIPYPFPGQVQIRELGEE